jgi:hypothetical protein
MQDGIKTPHCEFYIFHIWIYTVLNILQEGPGSTLKS